jgi:hypothetical protein
VKQSPELTRAAAVIETRARATRRAKRKNQQLNSELLYLHRHHVGMSLDQIVDSLRGTNHGVKAMNLYNCKSVSDGYRITKFTRDYVVESSYIVSAEGCDCPAGARPVCRHRTMLPFFEDGGHIDDGWFFIWDTRQWLKPTGEAEGVAKQNEAWKVRPQGAPSTSEPIHDSDCAIYNGPAMPAEACNCSASRIEQADPGIATDGLAQPAPPEASVPIAPQTEPASAEGAGFKFRRPKL